ncbi:formyltetrahydrofolate deformylase [soil metagenome]
MNGAADTPTARLVISCPDGPGIVAAVSEFLFRHGANILSSDQHSTDPEGGAFFMRMVFSLARLDVGLEHLEAAFDAEVGERFEMDWRLAPATERKRTAIMVSREDHCLLDLLWRWRAREIEMDVGLVVSNHPDLRETVAGFGVPFELVPVTAATKAAAEARQLELLAGRFDLVVLARYMQILSKSFLEGLGAPAINIHHSFLPAFAGASPYEQAKERGVKMIGATAHYVTEELDAGPIIEQDVIRVSHRHGVDSLRRMGRDIERTVLVRAVRRHCEDRVLAHANKTVVF